MDIDIASFLLGAFLGADAAAFVVATYVYFFGGGPMGRVYRKLLRAVRKGGYTLDEIRRMACVTDLSGERFAPLVQIIRSEGLTLEMSTEVLDRVRLSLLPSDEMLPEYEHGGWPRSTQARRSNAVVDQATSAEGVYQPARREDNIHTWPDDAPDGEEGCEADGAGKAEEAGGAG